LCLRLSGHLLRLSLFVVVLHRSLCHPPGRAVRVALRTALLSWNPQGPDSAAKT
jgi:hypothetical protein